MNDDHRQQLNDEMEAAAQAKQIVNNPMYKQAIIMIRGDLYNKFKKCGWKDDDERREIWRKEQIVDWFEEIMNETLETGKLAEQSLTKKIRKVVGI